MQKQKRVLAVNDISCVGRCSLTVALPILSAVGFETSVLPTALLSAHTGFEDYTFFDLTDQMVPSAERMIRSGRSYQGICTGYLGSFRQLQQVSRLIDSLKNDDCLVMVDPVMADNGEYYALFDAEYARGMASLCGKANIITPNATEAMFLLGLPYTPPPYTDAQMTEWLTALSRLGPSQVVITGLVNEKGNLVNAHYDRKTDDLQFLCGEKIEGYYPGSGDVFCSALFAALLSGICLDRAVYLAHATTHCSILRTLRFCDDPMYGLDFEGGIPEFINKINRWTDPNGRGERKIHF